MQNANVELARDERKFAVVVRPADGRFLRQLQREAKAGRGWSAARVAENLGVTRATFKGMQTGKKTIGEMPQIHARNLHRELLRERAERGEQERDLLEIVFLRGFDSRMKSLEILFKPRKCDGCGRWFVPVNSRQLRHNTKKCRSLAAHKRRSEQARRKRRKTK